MHITESQEQMERKNLHKRKRRKRKGRKRIKRAFDGTRIGHFLKHEAPLEYKLITDTCNSTCGPPADLIETIGYSSTNPLFRKEKFRKCLIEYRKYGVYCGKPVKSSSNVELYYMRIRKNLENEEIRKLKSNVKKERGV